MPLQVQTEQTQVLGQEGGEGVEGACVVLPTVQAQHTVPAWAVVHLACGDYY